jgi:hypothetical protein
LRVKITDNAISEIEEVYSEDGNMLSGTSSATYVNGKLVIGTVSKKAAICDMDYLSDNGDSESDKLPGTHIKI